MMEMELFIAGPPTVRIGSVVSTALLEASGDGPNGAGVKLGS